MFPESKRPPRLPMRRISAEYGNRLTAHTVVGLAHVVLGAYVLAVAVPTLVFASGISLVLPALLLLDGLLLALAGLWIHDGQRRGGVLAAILDGLRLALVLSGAAAIGVDTLFNAGLLGGVLWLWPTLQPAAASRPGT